jgi:hypothetical protein
LGIVQESQLARRRRNVCFGLLPVR